MSDDDFEKHQAWAERICRHFCFARSIPRHNQDDMKQAALIGLLEAVRRFNGSVSFRIFARRRVFGALMDEFRLLVGRSIKKPTNVRIRDYHSIINSDVPVEIKEEIDWFMSRLDEREERIIRLIQDNVFQRQIGEMMNITESRICQIVAILIAKAKSRWRE